MTDPGVGGIFSILIIRMVFEFLGRQKRNGKSGERDPEYWKSEFRKAVKDETAEELREIKSMLGRLLDRRDGG